MSDDEADISDIDEVATATPVDPMMMMLGQISEQLSSLRETVVTQSTAIDQIEDRVAHNEARQRLDDLAQDTPDRFPSRNRDHRSQDRRQTVLVQAHDVDIRDLPRSLRDPKIDFSFSGQGDVDAFLQRIENACAFAPTDYWASYVIRALTGSALAATTAEFPRPLESAWDDVAKFLRDRFRHPHFALVQMRELLTLSQRTSAAKFFQVADQKISQAGLSHGDAFPEMDKTLISILSIGIKSEIYEKLRSDADKFVFPEYTYAQFKLDVIAIDSALYVKPDKGGSRNTPRVATVTGDSNSVARRPAYSHATDYKGDTTCRYCKSDNHLAPVCNTLYKKMNGGDSMPNDLKQKNIKILKD
jgi:hypothetical protein